MRFGAGQRSEGMKLDSTVNRERQINTALGISKESSPHKNDSLDQDTDDHSASSPMRPTNFQNEASSR